MKLYRELSLNSRRHRTRPFHANGLVGWGRAASGGTGGGYYVDGFFPFPQGVINLTNIAQVAIGANHTLAKTHLGEVYTMGENAYGEQGFGEAGGQQEIPTRLLGGLPLYKAETLTDKHGSFSQPEGPNGPLIGVATAVAAASSFRSILSGGRVLTCGANSQGQLGNGWTGGSEAPKSAWETGNWKPQYAPFPVLTGGPPGDIAAGETNVLRNVTMMALAHQCAYYVSEGKVFYTGNVAALENGYYATHDPLFDGLPIIAIAGNRHCLGVILSDHTVRIGGINGEGLFGIGVNGGSTAVRSLHTPEREVSPGVFEPLREVIALAFGEYHWKALKSDGTVWTDGSNGYYPASGAFIEEGQQGLGPRTEPVLRPTQIAALGTDVIAIDADGEERGNGEYGGDVTICLHSDKTVSTFGKQYDNGAMEREKGEGVGTLGDGTVENRNTPVKPAVTGIVAVATGAIAMIVTQEPGAPATASCKATLSASGVLDVSWLSVPGTPWRGPEGWTVHYTDSTGSHSSGPLSAGTLTHAFTGVQPGEVTVKIEETATTVEPVPTGPAAGAIQTATAKKCPLEWGALVKPEPAIYVEWRRTQTYVNKKGQVTQEKWNRSPELSGSARRFLIELEAEEVTTSTGKETLTGEQIEVRITGSFEGTFGTRLFQAQVLP